MLSIRLVQLSLSVIIAFVLVFLVFFTQTWLRLMGVATVTGISVFAGFRTVTGLSLLQSDVIAVITLKIFPFVRRKVKLYGRSVDVPCSDYELNSELSKLLSSVVQHCVESWYYHISECQSPVYDAQLLIDRVTKCLVSRLSSTDRFRFLYKVLRLYEQHLKTCGGDDTVEHGSNSATLSSDIHVLDATSLDAIQHLNAAVFAITSKLLDEQSVNCLIGKEILAQIIVKEVFLRLLDLASEPMWLFDVMADILSDSSRPNTCSSQDIVASDQFCTHILAKNNSDSCPSSSNCCVDDAISRCGLFVSQTSTNESEDMSTSGNSTGAVEGFCVNAVGDSKLTSYDTECGLYITEFSDYVDVNNCISAHFTVDDTEDISTADSLTNLSEDSGHENVRLLRHNSDCLLTSRQTFSERVSNGYGYNCGSGALTEETICTSGEVVEDRSLQCAGGAAKKKRFSLGNILPSAWTKERPKCLCHSLKDGDVDWQFVGRGASGNELEAERHSEEALSSHSEHTPHFASGLQSVEGYSADDAEFECAENEEVIVTEAGTYQPKFLFHSVSISDAERDAPVSKPYAVYIISVRAAISYFNKVMRIVFKRLMMPKK